MPPVTIKIDDLALRLDLEFDGNEKRLPATEANLKSVSQIYRALVESGEVAPASWLAKQLGVPDFAVARVIAVARKRGLLLEL